MTKKEKHKYVFPNLMAKMMKKIDMRTQMESSMLSMIMIMTGMIIMATYLLLFIGGSLFYKFLILFNLGAAFLFISSFLVTTYQQYISYMDLMGIDPDEHKAEIKRRGNIFKRIYLAIKNRKRKPKKKKLKKLKDGNFPKLNLVEEALYNKKIIDNEREISMKELNKKADILEKQSNTIEKEVK